MNKLFCVVVTIITTLLPQVTRADEQRMLAMGDCQIATEQLSESLGEKPDDSNPVEVKMIFIYKISRVDNKSLWVKDRNDVEFPVELNKKLLELSEVALEDLRPDRLIAVAEYSRPCDTKATHVAYRLISEKLITSIDFK